MDVQQKLDEIVATVDSARSMPMSASCVLNRAELLAKLNEVREALPGSLAQAQEVLGDREQVVAEARQEAQRIIEAAEAQRDALVAETEIVRRSQAEAERILAEARRETEQIRAEADDYVDSKLANFEVVLTKTIGSVDRGREKLLGRAPGAAPDEFDDAPERSSDPQELRARADAYVEAQFRAFEAVLRKTLEAVGRGRQKLLGHRPIDELAAHMAAQEGAPEQQPRVQGDDDYLAHLAEPAADGYPAAAREQGGYPAEAREQGGYPQQDGYGYPPYPASPPPQDAPAPAGDPRYATAAAGYPSADTYTAAEGYPGAEGYPAGGPAADGYAPQGYPDYPAAGYPADGYGQHTYQQQGYDQQGYAQDTTGYGWQSAPEAGGGPGQGYGPTVGQPPQQPPQQPAALDETSLFDTSLIDVDQLRQYREGT